MLTQQNFNSMHLGFTLLELLAVVMIIALISTIAYPTFLKTQQETRRADARAALIETKSNIERFLALKNQNSITNADITTILGPTPPYMSKGKHYILSVSTSVTPPYYTITASATGIQAQDSTCTTITLDSNDDKQPSNCW